MSPVTPQDLLNKVAQLGSDLNKSDGSLSKGTVKRMMTNKAKPTVSDAFRLQLQVRFWIIIKHFPAITNDLFSYCTEGSQQVALAA